MVEHFLKQKQELLIHGSLFTPDQTFAWLSWTKWNIGKLLYKTICCVNMLKKLMVDTIHQKSGLSNKTNNILKHEQFDFWPVRECRWFPALSFGTFQTGDSKDSVKKTKRLQYANKKKLNLKKCNTFLTPYIIANLNSRASISVKVFAQMYFSRESCFKKLTTLFPRLRGNMLKQKLTKNTIF